MLISVLFAINVAYHSNSERININEYIAKIEKVFLKIIFVFLLGLFELCNNLSGHGL